MRLAVTTMSTTRRLSRIATALDPMMAFLDDAPLQMEELKEPRPCVHLEPTTPKWLSGIQKS